jgi:2'-5' RNA ligase
MPKIAIDVVLLPSNAMTQMAIEINKELLKKFEDKIILDKKECQPHISLCMGCFEYSSLEKMGDVLAQVAKGSSALYLRASRLMANTIPTGRKVSEIVVERNPALQSLHEKVMTALAPLLSYDATLEALYQNPKPEEVTLGWINNYRFRSSFENFRPHITVGFGETIYRWFPTDFTASKLALCHLGNYCTCRRVIWSAELQS